MSNKTLYEFEKDGFRKGEWSIYLRTYNKHGQLLVEHYCLGISKKYEVTQVVKYLNIERNNK